MNRVSSAAVIALVFLVIPSAIDAVPPSPPPAPVSDSAFAPVPDPGGDIDPSGAPRPVDALRAPHPPTAPDPSRPSVALPTAPLLVVTEPTAPPVVTGGSGHSISGLASYYCCTAGHPSGDFAAVGPQLRVALGGGYAASAPQPWKGRTVTVCGSKGCASVTLIDWCQCYWKQTHPREKLIDLYPGTFEAIGASVGTVTVSW